MVVRDGLTNGTRYRFRIRAMVGSVAGTKSSSVSAIPAKPLGKPAGISARTGSRQVMLRWDDLNNRHITRYQIKQWTGSSESGSWADIPGSGSRTTSHLVTGLTSGVKYSFRIRAVASCYLGIIVDSSCSVEGTESDVVRATPVAQPPRSPARPQAVAGDGQVTLSWDNPNNPDITKYQIRQWTGGGERGSWGDWTDIHPSDKDTVRHLVTGLTNGVKYSFRIRAMAGTVTGLQSPYTAVVIPAVPVVVPGSITVAVSDSIAISVGIVNKDTRAVDSVVPTTEAGGSYTFTVVLDTQPSADVSIAVSSSDPGEGKVDKNSLVFTTANWNVAQTITVTGQDDSLADGDQDYTIVLAVAVSADANYHGIDPIDIAVTNTDDDGAGVTLSTTSVTVTEATGVGHTATYSVVLDSQPTDAVTITPVSGNTGVARVVSPASLTFTAANWDTAQQVTVIGVDDRTDADRTTTISHTIAGGGYDSVSIPDVAVTLVDDDTVEVLIFGYAGDTLKVTEADGSMRRNYYKIVLNTQPLGAVTITPTSGDTGIATVTPSSITFTAANWADPQSITVTGVDDRTDADRTTTVSHTIAGGGYDSVSIPDVAITLIDDDGAGVTLSTTSVTVTEATGSRRTATYSVVLDSQPTDAVTITPTSGDTGIATVTPSSITFTAANWADPQSIAVTGVDDRTDADRTATISHTIAGGGYDSVSIPDVAVTLVDDDTVEVLIFGYAGDTLKVTEADGSMRRNYYKIVLNTQPLGAVTITPTSGDTGIATVTPSSITFTAANWADPQSITVTGVDDRTDADRTATISHTIAGGGYDSVSIPDVAITLTDDDRAGVTLSTTSVTVTEATGSGRTATYSVVLDSQPTDAVTITPTSGDTSIATVTPSSITFTAANWADPQSIAVTGVDDRADADRTTTISHTIAGGGYDSVSIPDVAITLTDDDGAGVTLSTTSVTVTEATGSRRTATYSVVLDSQPTDAVTITPTSGDTGIATVTPSSITFTAANWADPQSITVTGVDDRTDADRTATISHTIAGGGYDSVSIPDVAVTLVDDDTVEVLIFGYAGDTLKVTEADGSMRRNYYKIVLNTQPLGAVTITPTSGDTGIATVTPSSITFTAANWADPQSITVTGVDDRTDADRTATISHTIAGGGYDSVSIPDVAITLTDDDRAGVTLSTTSVTVTEATGSGRTATYSVVLDSQPTDAVTITPTSGDTSIATVTPSSITFTAANWADPQSIAVTGVDDRADADRTTTISHTIAGGGYDSVSIPDVAITLTDDDGAGVTLSTTSVTVTEATGSGRTATYSVVLDSQPTDAVTITPTSGDTSIATVTPSSITFTAANWGTAQQITVIGMDDTVDTDRRTTITHTISGGGYTSAMVQSVAVTVTDDDRQHIAQHLLARIGHTLGSQAVDVIGERFTVTRSPAMHLAGTSGAHLTLGGRQLDADLSGLQSLAGLPGYHRQGAHHDLFTLCDQDHSHIPASHGNCKHLSMRELLLSSAFQFTTAGQGGKAGMPGRWSVWGRAVASGQRGTLPRDVSIDNDVVSGWVGADYTDSDNLVGLAISHSETRSRFDFGTGTAERRTNTSLTSVHPYVNWLVHDNLEVWGLLGLGWGDLRFKEDDGSRTSTSVNVQMAAVGARTGVVSSDYVDLSLKTDAFVVRMGADAVTATATAAAMPAVTGEAQRLRVLLEGHRQWLLSAGQRLQPNFDLGARLDTGDAQSGAGLEVGAGVVYEHPRLGFSIDARGRWLVTHSDDDVEEWSASMGARLDPGASGRGVSLTLTPVWGQEMEQGGALWKDEAVTLLGNSDTDGKASMLPRRLDLKLSYGVEAWGGHGLVSPYAELHLQDGQLSRVREGIRLEVPGLAAGLQTEVFVEHNDLHQRPEHRIEMNASLRF